MPTLQTKTVRASETSAIYHQAYLLPRSGEWVTRCGKPVGAGWHDGIGAGLTRCCRVCQSAASGFRLPPESFA